jgi:hypothetical protein
MDKVEFLEQLATMTSHDKTIDILLDKQSVDVREAYFSGNSELLKAQFSNIGYLANEIQVIEL